jgi:hypothetical protein
MSKKTASDPLSRNMELINKKVKEINERRRGLKVTRIEDELDRQELKTYVRLMGVEQGSISLESAEEENRTRTPRNNIFYATIAVEALIELALIYITFSYLTAPAPGMNDYILAAVVMGMFTYIAYLMFKSLRVK